MRKLIFGSIVDGQNIRVVKKGGLYFKDPKIIDKLFDKSRDYSTERCKFHLFNSKDIFLNSGQCDINVRIDKV